MPRDEQYLVEIVEASGDIGRWLTGVDTDGWAADDILQSAVLLKLITIGEAARALSTELRGRHPEVEWRDATAFRNMAVHEYFAIEWARVWSIARRSAPSFARQVLAVLYDEFPEIAAHFEGVEPGRTVSEQNSEDDHPDAGRSDHARHTDQHPDR